MSHEFSGSYCHWGTESGWNTDWDDSSERTAKTARIWEIELWDDVVGRYADFDVIEGRPRLESLLQDFELVGAEIPHLSAGQWREIVDELRTPAKTSLEQGATEAGGQYLRAAAEISVPTPILPEKINPQGGQQ